LLLFFHRQDLPSLQEGDNAYFSGSLNAIQELLSMHPGKPQTTAGMERLDIKGKMELKDE
jgi:hypothetical protein